MSKNKSFVPLHVHSEFSALDGASRVKDLVKKAADSGMPALAITDHGVMHSMVSLYKYARDYGVKPIIGCEVYVSPKSRFDKIKIGEGEKNAHHLILLAKNATGFKNLNKLCSRGHLEGFYYKPRIDDELLGENSEGLIALSACLGGKIPQHLIRNEFDKALEATKLYQRIFGEDFYLELQDHFTAQQAEINKLMVQLHEQTGAPLVATNDSHFTNREDKALHDILLAIATGATISRPNKMFYEPEHYFKTPEEMWEIPFFNKYGIALENTLRIAEKCNYVMELGNNSLPDFPVPEGHTQATYLRELTYRGLEKRYGRVTDAIRERADYELGIIENMGFPGYLLIVWDYINWAKNQDIPVGPGRGSAAGSIICYAIEITDVDPISRGLLFERFLNPERVSMPDIDVDFCIEGRQRVMNYVAQKYGEDRVCQIVTFGTMAAKGAFKDVARYKELDYSESSNLTKLIGDTPGMTLEKAWEVEDFRVAIQDNPKALEIFEDAKKIEGTIRNFSTHAAGVIISKHKLEEVIPLMRVKESDKEEDEDGSAKLSCQSQLEQKDAEDLGLLKMDFLGLRNLTMINKTIKLIEANHGIKIDWHDPELKEMDDPKVYEFIATGHTLGLFQIESAGMTKLIVRMKPTNFEDISAVLALFRPGPLQSGYVDEYVDRKHGKKPIEYAHPELVPILGDTYGTMVFQEQIMQIAQVLAGYTLGQADLLRRAMGKKKADEMAKQREIFLDGARNHGVADEISNDLFDKMTKFSEYCFNRAHTAAYAVVTYRTAWLKTYYPAEFMAALMSSLAGKNDRILECVNECKKLGIKVLPPDINESEKDFTVVEGNIRFGLLSINGIGEDFVDSIVDNRSGWGRYESLTDFCARVSHKTYNARSLANMIKSGSFDNMERNRRLLINQIEEILPTISKQQKARDNGQFSLFGEDLTVLLDKTTQTHEEVIPFLPQEELEFERELMGIYISSHPLLETGVGVNYHTTHSTTDIVVERSGEQVAMCVILRNVKKHITKKSQRFMAFLKLEDPSGTINAVCFPDAFEKFSEHIVENNPVQVFGKIDKDKDGVAQLIIDRIRPLHGLKALHLTLPGDANNDLLMSIERTVAQFKGDIPIVIHFIGHKEAVVTNMRYWVSYSNNLVSRLSSLIGKDNIKLE